VRETVTTEAVIKGNQAVFLVADSGGATATTRGTNGLIPARTDNLAQNTATLVEWHDLSRKTDFNIFAGQGNQRAIMQQTTMGVLNRRIDQDIIAALLSGKITTGAALTGGVNLAMKAKVKLGNAQVPWDGNIFALITPAFEAYLMQTKEFASREYVGRLPMEGADASWSDKPTMYRWLGVNWIVHPNLPGAGTAAESSFMYHKTAVGHAMNVAGLDSEVGYNAEQKYSWARASADMGAVLLQNAAVVEMVHDGSAYS
jgi:hypothetical protein